MNKLSLKELEDNLEKLKLFEEELVEKQETEAIINWFKNENITDSKLIEQICLKVIEIEERLNWELPHPYRYTTTTLLKKAKDLVKVGKKS